MGLKKREYTDQETVITAENMNDIQDAVIALEDGLFSVDNDKSGEVIAITDAAKRGFRSFSIYGKTTQNGIPTPSNPVELVSVGDSGSITVKVTGESNAQSITIATPNGLPGIIVPTGGNYTDANGKRWICDEIDFARGVYVQRIVKLNISEYVNWHTWGVNYRTEGQTGFYHFVPNKLATSKVMCNILPFAQYAWGGEEIGVSATGPSTDSPYVTVSVENNILADVSTNDTACASLMSVLDEAGAYMLVAVFSPIETPLSEEELAAYAALYTYKDNTTVTNNAGAWMDLEYVMDAKKYIDRLMSGTIVPATVE